MAIRTQQLQVSIVGGPIFKSALPGVTGLGLDLTARVNVINVKCAEVVKSATDAFTTERFNEIKLSAPVSWMLVNGRTMFVPIRLLTCGRAVSNIARLAALFTLSVSVPTVCKVALLATIFTSSLTKAIGMHFDGLAAAGADNGYGRCSHTDNIVLDKENTKYFDIAVRRISDALKQPDLFIEKPKPPKQEAMI